MYRDSDGFQCFLPSEFHTLYLFCVIFRRFLPLLQLTSGSDSRISQYNCLLFGCCMTFSLRHSFAATMNNIVVYFDTSNANALTYTHTHTLPESTHTHIHAVWYVLSTSLLARSYSYGWVFVHVDFYMK